jgi:hypothetical protein
MASRATKAACFGDVDEKALYEAPATAFTYVQNRWVANGTGLLTVLKHKKMNITRVLLLPPSGSSWCSVILNRSLLTGDQFELVTGGQFEMDTGGQFELYTGGQFNLDKCAISWSHSDPDQPQKKFSLVLNTTQQARELEKIMSSNRTPASQTTKAPTPIGTAKKSQVKREAPNFRYSPVVRF